MLHHITIEYKKIFYKLLYLAMDIYHIHGIDEIHISEMA